MRIKYTEFAVNPALRGTTTHLPQHRAVALIDAGFAVEVPPARRGTNEWLAERAEIEALRVAAIPESQRETFYATAQWQLSTAPISQDVTIVRLIGRSEKTVFVKSANVSDKDFRAQMRDVGCPDNVISAYLESVHSKVDPEVLQERQIQERNRQYAALQTQHQRENGAAAAIVGQNSERPR